MLTRKDIDDLKEIYPPESTHIGLINIIEEAVKLIEWANDLDQYMQYQLFLDKYNGINK